MSRLTRYLIPLGLAAFLLLFTGTANAQKVANPGNLNFRITTGSMQVKDQVFSFDESQNINFNGTVNAAGDISIPSLAFPDYPISAGGFNLTVKINVVGPTTGNINPLTGAISLRLRVWIKIDGVPLGGGCRIASAGSPVDVNTLITGTSGPRTGTPYNPSAGTAKIVNSTFAVPASSDCGIAGGTVNDTVGIPSAAGSNAAEFNIRTTPIVNRAIVPALTATPLSGTAPFTTTLSAAGSTITKGPATYRWDFTNDGTIDQTTSTPTTTHTYTAGGTPTARVQVVDADGDVAQTTRQLTVNAFPDLGISVGHDADFRVGSSASYKVNLTNHGYAATSGAVSVSTTLPAGLGYSGVSGAGWGCAASGQDLTCTRSAAVAVGASAPELGINLAVGPEARGEVEPVFTVAAAGDNGPGNNSASDLTRVRATDLKLALNRPSHAMLLGPDPANVIEMTAKNIGDAATAGPSVIVNDLPEGLTPLAATGSGWNCEIAGQKVTCTHDGTIDPGATSDPVTVTVDATLEPGSLGITVDNQATLTTADDVDPDNDSVTDPTLILDGQDLGIVKSHEGIFTAGQDEQYTLAVTNHGVRATTGPATVTDVLPDGLEFVAADGGPDWACEEEDGTVTCIHDDPIAPGADAAGIELTLSVGVAAIPEVTNAAAVNTPDDPNPANDSSSDTATVQAIDLTIEKTHEGLLRVGNEATYTLAVRNVGDSPTVGPATVTDELPAGLGFVSVDGGPAWDCAEASGTVTCEHADILAANELAPEIQLTTMVGPAAAPEVTNTAGVTTEDDFNPGNDESSDDAVVIDVDTAVNISRTGSFRPGQTGTYLVIARNEGTVPTANPTEVVVELPAGLEFNSVSGSGWSCDELDGTVTCSRPSGLGAATTAPAITLRVDVTVAAVPGVETTAIATTEGDRYPDNDSDTDEAGIPAPDLTVDSSHEGPFRIGRSHSYLLEVTNQGSGSTASPITVTDTLPSGFEASAAFGPGWDCEITGLTVACERTAVLPVDGTTPPVRIDVNPAPAALPAGETSATVTNEVVVSSAIDSDPANNSSSDETDLVAVDLAAGISGTPSVAVGGIAEYDVTVENRGSAGTDGVIRVSDTLPAGFSPRPSDGTNWTCSTFGSQVTCDYSLAVAAGESAPSLTIRARAGNAAIGNNTNEITVSTPGDVIGDNDSASIGTEVTAAPDLELKLRSVSPGGETIMVGSDSGYQATVSNHGSAASDSPVTVRIELPTGLRFVTQDGGDRWECSASGTTVTCVLPDSIGTGESSSFGFLVEVAPSAPAAVAVTASLASGTDPNTENDTSVAVADVVMLDLGLTRSHTPDWIRGSTGSYQLKVTNEGSAATTSPVSVTEILPAGTTFLSATGDGWSCQVSQRTLTCVNPDNLGPGAVSDLGINLGIGDGAGSSIEAKSLLSLAGDSNPANDVATEVIPVRNPSAASDSGPVRIRKGKVNASTSGRVTLWVTCPASSASRCRGTLRLKTIGKVKVNRRKRARINNLGRANYSVAPGRSVPVRFRLTKRGRKALKFNRKFRARATATNIGRGPSRANVVIRRAR